MSIDFLRERFKQAADRVAIVWKDQTFSYDWLLNRVLFWQKRLQKEDVQAGRVVALEADFSPNAIALMLSLIDRQSILVPLTDSIETQKEELRQIAEVELLIQLDDSDQVRFEVVDTLVKHTLYQELQERNHPGLVLFSSGITGKSKAAVHDVALLLEKYRVLRHDLRTITFLMFDHIGGVDTLFYCLSNMSCIITLQDRSPHSVCAAIERYQAEVLPVSPSFLNLLLLSEVYKRYDMSSLQYITYGAEVMPKITLKRISEFFPYIQLLQKYGTTEVGTLRSQSKSSDSLWVKIGGEGFETRVVDGILHIKARSAMLGYLNAPSPFTEDGWFNTGDAVEVEGEYMRILGRKSELINVGGEKVYPAEVESIIQEMEEVAEVAVYSEPNPITGQIVCAKITPSDEFLDQHQHKELTRLIKKFCNARLQPYKVPVKISIINRKQHGARFKKVRKVES